jgi:hypothetical protein
MLKMLNKFVSFLAIGIIGYLTYSSLNEPASSKAEEGKALPNITKKMLSPVFVEPQAYASPANRDPFTSSWDKYINSAAAMSRSKGNSAPSGETVDFPQKLMGIIGDANGQRLASIGGEVYGVGSSVTLEDSNEIWQVISIESESVILTRNGQRAVLKIADNNNDSNDSNNIQTGIAETKGQKESVK